VGASVARIVLAAASLLLASLAPTPPLCVGKRRAEIDRLAAHPAGSRHALRSAKAVGEPRDPSVSSIKDPNSRQGRWIASPYRQGRVG